MNQLKKKSIGNQAKVANYKSHMDMAYFSSEKHKERDPKVDEVKQRSKLKMVKQSSSAANKVINSSVTNKGAQNQFNSRKKSAQ